MTPPAPQVTELLLAWGQGDEVALEQLMPLVYDELRRLARRHLARERSRTDLLAYRERWFAGGTFSPDGRWITFLEVGLPLREHIAPFQGETPSPESAWVSVLGKLAEWSPDGTLVHGVSDHDGFQCIWAQRVDWATKRPVGSPLPIFHAHGSRLSVYASVSVGRAKVVFDMAERGGNIWMAQWKGGR
jgi:hypothetical protein